jgi:2-polyprenyl-3-methyl-5-hydroxy-6-metoxy-1,4-benzoquinol methylase
MTEWKLFDEEIPEPSHYLAGRSWMSLEAQPGFAQRAQMVTDLVRYAGPVASICDLGCGDGSLLARLRLALAPARIPMWGYDLGAVDVAYGQARGLDTRLADIVQGEELAYGELVIASEVVEHLADPEGFLRGIGSKMLIVSSPSA